LLKDMIIWVLKWLTLFRWLYRYLRFNFIRYLVSFVSSSVVKHSAHSPCFLYRVAWLDFFVGLISLILQKGSRFQLMFIGGYDRWGYFGIVFRAICARVFCDSYLSNHCRPPSLNNVFMLTGYFKSSNWEF
jgi:hypothetical protein